MNGCRMNARYAYGGVNWGGGRMVDSGFNDFSPKQLADLLPRLSKGGLVTVHERGLILHVYFTGSRTTIEYYPDGHSPGFEGPVFDGDLKELFEAIERGSDPTELVVQLPRIRRTTDT